MRSKFRNAIRFLFSREKLAADPGEPSEAPKEPMLSDLFGFERLPQDPEISDATDENLLQALFGKEHLPKDPPFEASGNTLADSTQSRGPGILKALFERERLPKDPPLENEDKGFFRMLFERDFLPYDSDQS